MAHEFGSLHQKKTSQNKHSQANPSVVTWAYIRSNALVSYWIETEMFVF